MNKTYSLIGPAVFMDERGKFYKKASEGEYVPIQNKYTDAEDRFVQRNLEKKGWDNSCQKAF